MFIHSSTQMSHLLWLVNDWHVFDGQAPQLWWRQFVQIFNCIMAVVYQSLQISPLFLVICHVMSACGAYRSHSHAHVGTIETASSATRKARRCHAEIPSTRTLLMQGWRHLENWVRRLITSWNKSGLVVFQNPDYRILFFWKWKYFFSMDKTW